jgi:lipopolysaccharide export system ATP-binding protein
MSDTADLAALDRAFAESRRTPLPENGGTPADGTRAGLVANGLIKRYKKRTVVNGVSIHVGAGEIVGLLGPNGAGKTTSFYMIVGLIGAEAGRILLDSKDITRLPMHARARLGVGYLPQEASVFRKLSVADNIMAILEVRDDLAPAARASELERLLRELHIGHVRDGLGMSLSGGERRRTEIARALAANPRFMLLDEPFAGVDPIAVLDIQHIVRDLATRGIGVLITDHNVRETLGICNRAYILAEGQVIAEGAPAALLENETVRRVYLGEQFRL